MAAYGDNWAGIVDVFDASLRPSHDVHGRLRDGQGGPPSPPKRDRARGPLSRPYLLRDGADGFKLQVEQELFLGPPPGWSERDERALWLEPAAVRANRLVNKLGAPSAPEGR